jgi:hypothetical protein
MQVEGEFLVVLIPFYALCASCTLSSTVSLLKFDPGREVGEN